MMVYIKSPSARRKSTTLSTLVSFFIVLFISACSVTPEQNSPTTIEAEISEPNISHPEQMVIVEEDVIHLPPAPSEISVSPEETTPPPTIVSGSGTKQAWQKHQPRLTHKQRFEGVLQAHNGVRKKHGLQPLKWSDKLARYSQEWADDLGRSRHCQIRHRQGTPPFGENLYRSSPLTWSNGQSEVMAINIKEVVKAWTDEEKWYNYQRNSCQPGKKCGHYTQIVWKKTTEVGCAIKVCADKSQTWVCSYNPPGNWTGMRPY